MQEILCGLDLIPRFIENEERPQRKKRHGSDGIRPIGSVSALGRQLASEFDVVYINGDNNLMNVPLDPDKEDLEPRYKVRLIEEAFKRHMFDVKDV